MIGQNFFLDIGDRKLKKEFNGVVGIKSATFSIGTIIKDFCKDAGCKYNGFCRKDDLEISWEICNFCSEELKEEDEKNITYYIPETLDKKFPEILRYCRPVVNKEKPFNS